MSYPATERCSVIYYDPNGLFSYYHTTAMGKPHVPAAGAGAWATWDEAATAAVTYHGEWPVVDLTDTHGGPIVNFPITDPEWPAD